MRLARLRWLALLAVACRAAGSPPPAPSLASAPAAPVAVPTAPQPAPTHAAPGPPAPAPAPLPSRAPPAPSAPAVRYRVAIVPFATPYGDINAPSYAEQLAKLLGEVAAARNTVVALPDSLTPATGTAATLVGVARPPEPG